MTRVGLVALLTVVHAATLGSLAPLDLLIGAGLAVIVASACGRRHAPPLRARRARAVRWPRGIAVVVCEILSGCRTMARVLAGRQDPGHAGRVEVSTAKMNDRETVIAAWIATVSPGSVLLEIDHDRQVMRFHVIDARDPSEIRRDLASLPRRALPEPARG